jgi:hypothetical protein
LALPKGFVRGRAGWVTWAAYSISFHKEHFRVGASLISANLRSYASA